MSPTATVNIAFLSWENVYWLSQLLLVAFAGLALVSGRIVNNRQASQSLTLEKDLAEAKAKQAEAEKSLLELQGKIRWRHLPERDKFVAFIKEYLRGPLEIQYSGNDPESRNFALEIESAFKDAGWKDVHVNNNVMMFPQPVGLILCIHSADSAPQYGGAVQEVFKLIGLPTKTETYESQESGTLILKVGSKPPTE